MARDLPHLDDLTAALDLVAGAHERAGELHSAAAAEALEAARLLAEELRDERDADHE